MKTKPEKSLFLKIKDLRVTALCVAFFFCVLPDASAYDQNMRLTLNMHDVSLENILWTLEKESKLSFFYNVSDVSKFKKLDAVYRNMPLEDILVSVLQNTDLCHEIRNEVVVIRKKESRASDSLQVRKVKGRVVDAKTKEPMVGVTVVLEGTTIGVATDINGRFEFGIPKKSPGVLVISFVGMKTIKVKTIPGKEVYVLMEMAIDEIEEVVINGIFTSNKNSYTGAVTTVKSEELLAVSKTDMFKALKMLVPGLHLVENNVAGSNPNVVPEIIIRGMNSISSEETDLSLNRPLIILDKMEISLEQLYDIDMFEIERVDILKDASATAIYGERAANGVIVIARKKPKDSKLRVRYNFVPDIGFPDVSSFNLCSPMEKLELERRFGKYPETTGLKDELYNEKLKRISSGVNTDWKSIPLRNSWSHSHSLSFTGRGSGMDYGITTRYSDRRGVMKGDYRRNVGLNFYFSYHLGDKLLVSYRANYGKTFTKDSPYGNFSNWVRLNPYDAPKDKSGNWVKVLSPNEANPLYNAMTSSFHKTESQSFSHSLDMRWDIWEGFYFSGLANYVFRDNSFDYFISPKSSVFQHEADLSKRGQYTVDGGKSSSWDLSGTFNYSYVIDGEGTVLSANLGGGADKDISSDFGFGGQGFSKDRLNNIGFAQSYPDKSAPSGGSTYATRVNMFFHVNFILKNRYFADASYRVSGNSVIGRNERWAPYWSFGMGYNFHNERFISDMGWISLFRLRGSLGYVGSGNFGGNPGETVYAYKQVAYDGYIGASPVLMGNPDLRSQRTLKFNGGLSIGILKNRFSLNADYYKEVSKDLLLTVSLPPSVSTKKISSNIGESSNYGYEIALSGQIIKTQDWMWQLSANTHHTVNKILKISNALKNQNEKKRVSEEANPKILLEEGASSTALWVVRSAGIDPATGREIFIDKNGNYTFNYNAQDKVVVGNTNPKLEGSISTSLRWRKLSLYAGFSYTFGGDIYNITRAEKIENINVDINVDRRAFTERWNRPGDLVLYLKPGESSVGRHTERFVERKNELYFSTLNISYDLTTAWLNKIGIKRLALGVGFNDIGRLSTVKYERGVGYPYMRGYNFTISPTF